MTIAPEKTTLETGRVVAIAGPVVDVEFPPHSLPEINHAVEVDIDHRRRARSRSPAKSPSRSARDACAACA